MPTALHALVRPLLAIGLLVAASAQANSGGSSAAPEAALSSRNSPQAIETLCRAARRGDAQAQYELAWLYAHGRGVERHDDWAAYLFSAASLQGHAFAEKMLRAVTWPVASVPDCFVTTTALPAPANRLDQAPPHIDAMVRRLAPQYKVSPQLALAIIAVESNFDPSALSPKNAMGLMQLIPETAKRFGVRNAFDAQQNVRGGLAYLRWLLAYFEGDVILVAAAYNAGEGAVNQHRGIPPYDETREYVKRVMSRFGHFTQPYDAAVTAPSPQIRTLRKVAVLR